MNTQDKLNKENKEWVAKYNNHLKECKRLQRKDSFMYAAAVILYLIAAYLISTL